MNQQRHTNEDTLTDIFGSEEMRNPAPTEFIPKGKTSPEIAYQLVKDETYPQTQPRLNLATFVTTYMDDYATRLMNEAININYIDETEYPRVAVMCGRCQYSGQSVEHPRKGRVENRSAGHRFVRSLHAGRSGRVAALAQPRRKAAGKPFDKPNLVMSAGFQVVWEKFCQLWQIELRTVPLTLDKPTLDIDEALKVCDENTICIVPIAGVTWTGLDDDIEGLDKALDEYNAKTGYEIPIHVDAASGGFILPFLKPEKKWDFRLKWVLSISTSGHKYGLVYPGLGWVVWKDKKYLPDEMSFSVNYLGANITQVGLNFSRPAAQILGQYYNFIRLGFEGYKEVQQNSMDVAKYCHEQIGTMKCFRNYSKEVVNPLFIWMMNPEYDKKAKWTLFDLQAKLQQSGWMVPAYTMPKNIENVVVMRIVVRQGMSRDMADMLWETSATPWPSSKNSSTPLPRASSTRTWSTRRARYSRTRIGDSDRRSGVRPGLPAGFRTGITAGRRKDPGGRFSLNGSRAPPAGRRFRHPCFGRGFCPGEPTRPGVCRKDCGKGRSSPFRGRRDRGFGYHIKLPCALRRRFLAGSSFSRFCAPSRRSKEHTSGFGPISGDRRARPRHAHFPGATGT